MLLTTNKPLRPSLPRRGTKRQSPRNNGVVQIVCYIQLVNGSTNYHPRQHCWIRHRSVSAACI